MLLKIEKKQKLVSVNNTGTIVYQYIHTIVFICQRVQTDCSSWYERYSKVFGTHTGKHFHDLEAGKCLSKALTVKKNGNQRRGKGDLCSL